MQRVAKIARAFNLDQLVVSTEQRNLKASERRFSWLSK